MAGLAYRDSFVKPGEKRRLERPWRKSKQKGEINFKILECGGVEWIFLIIYIYINETSGLTKCGKDFLPWSWLVA